MVARSAERKGLDGCCSVGDLAPLWLARLLLELRALVGLDDVPRHMETGLSGRLSEELAGDRPGLIHSLRADGEGEADTLATDSLRIFAIDAGVLHCGDALKRFERAIDGCRVFRAAVLCFDRDPVDAQPEQRSRVRL